MSTPRSSLSRLRRTSQALAAPLLLVSLTLCSSIVLAVQPEPASSNPAPTRSPRDWVIIACNNEIATIMHDSSFIRYRTHVVDSKGDRIRDVVESKDGTVARTLQQGGKPLSSDADLAERTRLQDLAASPSAFARHVKNNQAGKKLATDLIRLLPDAMIYTPAADQANPLSASGAPLLVFDFAPNPAWSPPSTSSEALTGIRGRVWIDASAGYVVRLDAEIFRSVNIGWGMLAHVYPGGKLSLEQRNIGNNRWLYTHFIENARVRALMVKSIDVGSEVTTSDYQQLPSALTYQQAVQLLLR